MRYIKSCGFVVYKELNDKRLYLIIRTSNGEYGFPKGHVEENETERETAIRELKEETNIEVQIVDGFRCKIEYKFPNKEDVIKNKLFGPGENNIHFEEAIGDFIAVARNNKCIIYSNKSPMFKSHHAGLTHREMLIPVIVKEKQKVKVKGQ